ncbi:MAG: hypothetical protein KGY55_01765 [Candidatus Thermoplasmatota archaeon]|nr:hypothetical protein [Candidatus Thermoplasmatota archaeon]
MISVTCAACGRELFRYAKIGKGRLWHCWKRRISRSTVTRDGDLYRCPCGAVIGHDRARKITLEQHAFTATGTALR